MVSALCGAWRAVCTTSSPSLPFLPVSLEAPACDVHTLSCPPLSIHLHHSHPAPFLCHQLQSALLPPAINLSPPSVSSPLSGCLFHPLISSFLSESLLSLLLPSFFPPLYNFAPYVSIPLVLCHSLSVPHLFSTLLSSPSALSLLCLSAVLKYSEMNKQQQALSASQSF